MTGWVSGVGCDTLKPGELSRHSPRQKPAQRNSWGKAEKLRGRRQVQVVVSSKAAASRIERSVG